MNICRKIVPLLPPVLLFAAIFFLFSLQPVLGGETAVATPGFDYNLIVDRWQRSDGNYVIDVSNILPDGKLTVEYFNPRSIHVAKTAVSTENGFIKLFVEFQDKFYEGSTYTLFYLPEKDLLLGYYYQAPMDKTYEVIFMRKK